MAATSGGGGAGGVGGEPGNLGAAGTAGATEQGLEAVPGDIHRLNRFEYAATVNDVVGVKPPELQVSEGEIYGFDNNARVLGMRDTDFDQFYSAAGTVVQAAMADAKVRPRLLPCLHDGADCVARVIDDVGLRLFRRPLSPEEHTVYAGLYTTLRGQSLSHDAALEKMLVALMSSAQFLYRMEFSSTADAEPLNGYEQAARLSYLLWSSAPDDVLLEAARLDQLSQDSQLEQQLTRLWDDARSARFVQSFAGQWLGARRVAVHTVANDVSPAWTPALAAAASDEVLQNFTQVLQQDSEFLDIFRGTSHEVDAGLAPLYGLPPAAAGSRVTISGERAGYLGSVGFLALTSFERRTSPSMRGRVVLDNLLCVHLPPAPSDEPLLEMGPPSTSLRATYDSFRSTPACAACHQLFDPHWPRARALRHHWAVSRCLHEWRGHRLAPHACPVGFTPRRFAGRRRRRRGRARRQ
jgi:hypothetical protein